MESCTNCTHADDTVEIGYYFRCDVDSEIRWKDDCCDRFERRIGITASYDEIAQDENFLQ